MTKKALPAVVDSESAVLILGTMPGDQSIAKQQYYGNKGNYFWKILFLIFDEKYSELYDDRMALVGKHRIALWNVLASCKRVGSRDSNISDEVVNDFETLYKNYPNIKYVFFESKTAAKYYSKFVCPQPGITYQILPSTSGLNAGMSFAEKVNEWKALAVVLGDYR